MVRQFKKNFRKKPWYNKKYSVQQLAIKAWKGVKGIKRLINVEKKTIDFQGSSAVAGTWQNIYHISSVAEGDGPSARNGRSIKPLSIVGNMRVVGNAAATTTVIRIVIIKDTQIVADATSLTGLDIFERSEPTSLMTNTTLGRYKVLYDRSVTTTTTGSMTKLLKVNVRLTGHILYNGALVSDIQKNGYYMLAISNEATNTPSLITDLRLNYVDN